MDIPLFASGLSALGRLETRESSARLWLFSYEASRARLGEREHSRVPRERRSDAGMRERAGELKVKRDVKRAREDPGSERERVVGSVSRRGKQSASP